MAVRRPPHRTPEQMTAAALQIGETAAVVLLLAGIAVLPVGGPAPVGFIHAGLWMTMIVPLCGALASLSAFIRRGDVRAAVTMAGVLGILALGVGCVALLRFR